MTNASDSAARLCAACGMCCNGVLFHSVVLRTEDAPRRLSALGIRVKQKHGKRFFLQPCPAHEECRCAIYPDRPERCRKFSCIQLIRMRDGAVSETEALAVISEARSRASQVKELLELAGDTRGHKPLALRCESVFTPPLDASTEAAELRARLRSAMDGLEDLLRREFRTEPAGA